MEAAFDIQEVSPDVWIKNEDVYKPLLSNHVFRNKVPLVNCNALHLLQDNRLVRFRGMIQDMHNPEFYFESFELVHKDTKNVRMGSGKYRDTADVAPGESINYNSSNLKSAERQTMVTISFPGLNEWVQAMESKIHKMPHLNHPPSTSKNGNPEANRKRTLEEADQDMDAESNPDKATKDRKRTMSNEAPTNAAVSHEYLLNFPLPDASGKVCMIKVYSGFENLKLNDMVEVVGFLSVDPVLGGEWSGSKEDEEMDVETLTHNPPPSLVPRIHAVHIEQLHHCNPMLEQNIQKEMHMRAASESREQLHSLLSKFLLGDTLAADYLICHLISGVYMRKDVLTLGKFTLNLSAIPADKYPKYTEQLYRIIEQLVTKSHYLPLSVENMNTLTFLPKKDYDCNRLTSGILQLSKNTHLVLDETKMQPGTLDPSGVQNITALGEMISIQKIKYDFVYYKMDFDSDVPILVLSEGKSLLPSDFHLPIVDNCVPDISSLEMAEEIVEAVNFYRVKLQSMSQEFLDNVRSFLTTAQLAEYTIDGEPKYVQEDFVAMRKNIDGVQQNPTQEDLHNLLVLARLVSLSRGYNSLNQECWNIAKSMEEQRLARLQK